MDPRLPRRTAILIVTGIVPLLAGCSDPGGSFRPLTLTMRITYVDTTGPRYVFSPIPLSTGQQRKLYVEASTASYVGGTAHRGKSRCEPLAWTVDAPHLASVTGNGTIKGLKQGATTIRVRADCGATYGERAAERDVEIGDPATGSSAGRSTS